MILIISDESDYSTSKVIHWLHFLGKEFIRLNENSVLIIDSLTDSGFSFLYENKKIDICDISSVWYRRGNLNFKMDVTSLQGWEVRNIVDYNEMELQQLIEHIHNLFKRKINSLNNFNEADINKLDVLNYCSEIGLAFPKYLMTQLKSSLLSFYKKNNQKIISKPIKGPYVVNTKEALYSTYTHLISSEEIFNLPEFFTPTFFQQYIEKLYEIRVVYFNGEFFSMVIFSQSNEKTQVDFRHYDYHTPNRLSPFKLPSFIEKKISKLVTHFNLNFASLDILVSKENKYYLLEINPVGQFGMTSYPCNYNLERKIAEFL